MRKLALLLIAVFSACGLDAQSSISGIITISPQECVWRAGDDPMWAAPNLEASGWKPYTIWTLSRKQPRLWIRCHANLAALAAMPEPAIQVAFPGAYELFVDGREVGQSGDLRSGAAETDVALSWKIPRSAADADGLIALRAVYGSAHHAAAEARLEAGSLDELNAERDSRVLAAVRQDARMAACYLVIGAIGLALLGFYLAERSRTELLLLGIACLALSLLRLIFFADAAQVSLSSGTFIWFQAAQVALPLAEVLFFFKISGRRVPRAIAAALAILVMMNLVLAAALVAPLDLDYRLSAAIYLPPSYPYGVLILFSWAVLLSGVLTAFWSPRQLPRRLQVMAALCGAWVAADSAWFAFELAGLAHGSSFLLGRQYDVLAESRGYMVFAVVVALMALLLWDQRKVAEERAALAGEMQAAREIQRLLVPARLDTAGGLRIEVAFRPAQQVGGDFYRCRVLSGNTQRILLGDVSGKGAAAAMTASLLLGASEGHDGDSPAILLAHLSHAMLAANIGGFATCLCADISPSGLVVMANAGHLPPYCNGFELELPGSLPLGVGPDAEYAITSLGLNPGDSLTFLSDGVVEAQSPTGELFGFDRTRAISTQSAEEIARTAQAHGQQDDITVLTLTFASAAVLHA